MDTAVADKFRSLGVGAVIVRKIFLISPKRQDQPLAYLETSRVK